MLCPNCRSQLKCQESRSVDSYKTYREYGCLSCRKVFSSEEELDKEPLKREVHRSVIKVYKRRLDNEKSVRGK